MPRAKKTEEVKVETPEQDVQDVQPDTPEKAAYRALIERYKLSNPEKYELKKEELERKLNGIIKMETDKAGKRQTFITPQVSKRKSSK